MCGIAGIIGPQGTAPDLNALDRMAKALGHRGPDGQGQHVRGPVGMVQVRLAIIDLDGGKQPILDRQGRAIIANGEIYNNPELRDAMPGAVFTTGSDCEPPLHLYSYEGLGFTERLRGMYALAIDDPVTDRVILARDPFGIKPLYLAHGTFGVAFASEPQALIASGLVHPLLDTQARAQLLQLQFTCGSRTPFIGIERLAPGETVVISQGRIVQRLHRPALPQAGISPAEPETMLDSLDRVLADSVKVHQRADVPFGMFLSGGIDSASLLALMARLNTSPVLAYTAGFSGTSVHDERDHARALAKATGATHIEVDITARDFWENLPEIAAAMDDPAADYAVIPTYLLAKRARQDVKVILTGEGGDELFGGYGRYRGVMRPWPFTRGMRRKGTFDRLNVLRDQVVDGWRDELTASEAAGRQRDRTRLQQAQAVDCAHWLANDLLIKADRCLMHHGLEGRVPFLDQIVADFAFRLSDGDKVHGQIGKWRLRQWLDRTLPQAGAFEKKRGFTVPVADWMAAEPHLGELVARQPAIQAIADPGKVRALFAQAGGRAGFACWTLLFYALWHRRHMDGAAPRGHVLDTLSDC